jgi:FkbM family methyltransferase
MLRNLGYRGEIVSFEPIRAAFQELERAARGDQKWQVRNLALGAATGTAVINVSELSVYSSMLAQTADAQKQDSTAAVVRTEKISVAALDDLFTPFPHRTAFLKIDTQGFERQVLEGSKQTLPFLCGVLMELPIVHLYEATWNFPEAIEYMADRNFTVSQVHPTNFLTADPVSLVEVDCLFRRNEAATT